MYFNFLLFTRIDHSSLLVTIHLCFDESVIIAKFQLVSKNFPLTFKAREVRSDVGDRCPCMDVLLLLLYEMNLVATLVCHAF